MGKLIGFLAKYVVPLVWIKACEFVACALLASAVILLVPGVFYAAVGALGALRGGLIFAGVFYALTLYPLVSTVLLLVLIEVRVRSRLWLSLAAAVFMLSYTAFFASQASTPFPSIFWVAWLVMGFGTFMLTWVFLPNSRSAN